MAERSPVLLRGDVLCLYQLLVEFVTDEVSEERAVDQRDARDLMAALRDGSTAFPQWFTEVATYPLETSRMQSVGPVQPLTFSAHACEIFSAVFVHNSQQVWGKSSKRAHAIEVSARLDTEMSTFQRLRDHFSR